MIKYQKHKDSLRVDTIIKIPNFDACDVRALQLEICDLVQSYDHNMLISSTLNPFNWMIELLKNTLPTDGEYMAMQEIHVFEGEPTIKDLQKLRNILQKNNENI